MADKDVRETTVIGAETRISGEVRGDEDLVVRGRIDGRVQLTETLTVEAGGVVQADIEVKNLVVSGVVVGNVVASASVKLLAKARVIGDVTAPRFTMEEGAAYKGRVEMGEGEAARALEKRASRSVETPRQAPRLAAPARAAAAAPRHAAPPRVAAAPVARPALPRPETAAGVAPAWAKKKLRRR